MNFLYHEGIWLGLAALIMLVGGPISVATAVELQSNCIATGASSALVCAAPVMLEVGPLALATVGGAGAALSIWDWLRRSFRAE